MATVRHKPHKSGNLEQGRHEYYSDCPTKHRPPFECTTCRIRRRRENEPDTWYYKPRSWGQARDGVTIWHHSQKSNVLDIWADLDRDRPGLDELVWIRLVLKRCIAWGVNVDRVPVPLGAVQRAATRPAYPDKPGLVKATRRTGLTPESLAVVKVRRA